MMQHLRGLRAGTRAILVIGLITLLPAWAAAETLVIKNELNIPIIMQASCIVRGKVVRDRPVLLQPGDTVNVVLPGNKVITVSPDGKKSAVIGIIPGATEDQHHSIVHDGTKVKTEPTKPPP
jgi:hypothetical protein